MLGVRIGTLGFSLVVGRSPPNHKILTPIDQSIPIQDVTTPSSGLTPRKADNAQSTLENHNPHTAFKPPSPQDVGSGSTPRQPEYPQSAWETWNPLTGPTEAATGVQPPALTRSQSASAQLVRPETGADNTTSAPSISGSLSMTRNSQLFPHKLIEPDPSTQATIGTPPPYHGILTHLDQSIPQDATTFSLSGKPRNNVNPQSTSETHNPHPNTTKEDVHLSSNEEDGYVSSDEEDGHMNTDKAEIHKISSPISPQTVGLDSAPRQPEGPQIPLKTQSPPPPHTGPTAALTRRRSASAQHRSTVPSTDMYAVLDAKSSQCQMIQLGLDYAHSDDSDNLFPPNNASTKHRTMRDRCRLERL
ncbi:hypothetical protein PSTG_11937 [Puccinia striiformis f. sp. tritici PST-78]|uniref:Uncharacterized protein n=1 Tax=Puccinia striiformis f. sp. tritici PST-78 TaxID=1165861 RepID=A0A0L0V6D2_9BASI|nr:hypothetical protein PSTG_11937 [Puccinia striiformis f. sp. tritici PST-78]